MCLIYLIKVMFGPCNPRVLLSKVAKCNHFAEGVRN
jgi:hypothetical protein